MRGALLISVVLMILNMSSISFAKAVPFTQEDRERLIRVEENQKELEKRLIRLEERVSGLEKRFDDMQKRIDDVQKRIAGLESQVAKNREGIIRVEEGLRAVEKRFSDLDKRIDYLTNLIYVVLGGMIALIAFVIWDRRTALQPAINKNKELEERAERLERVIKELARRDPKAEEAAKNAGLL